MTRILVVDDDAFFGQMLMDWLKEKGYAAERVTSAEAALDRVRSGDERPDIFLVDERLGPGLSGVELISQLRSTLPEADAILFTGAQDPDIARQAYLAGAWRYLHRPFDPVELGYVLEALHQWRTARTADFERGWLRVLNRIVERLQKVNAVIEVGQILADGCVELGFDRARFYQVKEMDGEPTLFGVCQSGVNAILEFDELRYPLNETIYSKAAYEQRQPTFFVERELGDSFLSTMRQAEGRPENLGEWCIIPLFSNDRCIGFLNMDNCRHVQAIHPLQKDLLRLFAGQAAAALSRAEAHEAEQLELHVSDLAEHILHQMGDPADAQALDRLLEAIHTAYLGTEQDDNFIVVLQDAESGWYYYRLHIESGARVPPNWWAPSKGGLVEHVMLLKSPLFLPSAVDDYRQKQGIPQVGEHPALSWMGAPLRIGEKVVGVMVLENDHRADVYSRSDFDLFVALADRLVGVIQTAWLNEQQKKTTRLLSMLQIASEKLMELAVEKDEWLWQAMLTLCTADYGAGFDRAMLFLLERDPQTGRQRLRGHAAIGHLRKEDARRDWEADVAEGMNWEKYLQKLQNNELSPTPLHKQVKDFLIDIEPESQDAFARMVTTPKALTVPNEEAATQWTSAFLSAFDSAEYSMVPVQAGKELLGLVVLDNIWEMRPHWYGAISYLDALTNQAALTYELLQHDKALESLATLQRDVLSWSERPDLLDVVKRICTVAQTILDADLVSADILQDEGQDRYDSRYSGHVDEAGIFHTHSEEHQPGSMARHVIENRDQAVNENMVDEPKSYGNGRAGDHSFSQEQKIRANMATPIIDPRGQVQGILFVNYRAARQFPKQETALAWALAHLAEVALRNWREATGLRRDKESRDEELRSLSTVMQGALQVAQREEPDNAEARVIELLLDEVPSLFEPIPVTAGITLKRWQRQESDQEPVEIHQYIYPQNSGIQDKILPRKEDEGINSRAMTLNKIQNVQDVSQVEYYRRREGESDTLSELDVPIELDGRVIGAFNIESPQMAAFTKQHEEMAQRFAQVTTLALGNVRRQQNLRTVLFAANAVTGPTDFKDTLDKIVTEVRAAIPNLSMLVIWYVDPNSHKPRLGSYFGVHNVAAMRRESPRPTGAVQTGFNLDKPYFQPDVATAPIFQGRPFVKNENIQSTAIFPLRAQGKTVGVMFFSYREHNEFTDEERRLYPILAEVVATSINDSLQLHQTERERKRLHATQKVTEVIGGSTTAEQVLAGVRKALVHLYPRCTVYLVCYSERTGKLDLPSTVGDHHVIHANGNPDCFLCQLAEESMRTGKKQVRIQRQTRHKGKFGSLRSGTRASLGATLVSSDANSKRLLGVLALESPQEDAFDRDDKAIIRNVARQTRVALQRLEQEANERFQSTVIGNILGASPIIHDINQYTGRILHRVERLQREPALTDAGQRALSELREQIGEMSDRTTAMDIRRGKLTPVAIDAELPRWINETLNERSVSISLDLDLNLPDVQVNAYPKALRRVIYDLTRNAMEAMGLEAQEQQLRVSTHLSSDSGQVEICIHNNGPAIPSAIQSKLFNDIYSSKSEGHGIGLIFVRAAIERMGGQVWLESSTKDGGTTFTVRLKVAAAQDEL